jgi:cobalt-precorrin-5B (C1)-methyltransferase
MNLSKPRSGYTLPVFATAAAIAALRWLRQDAARDEIESVQVDLITPAQTVEIPIEQVSGLKPGMALAIARSDPGDNLDLTRNTPVWALVEQVEIEPSTTDQEQITLQGGEGIGRIVNADVQPAIYAYAQRLLRENLGRLLAPDQRIVVTIVLPQGRQLAQRTSNAAFGVVEGLSLLGTTGISQPLSAPGQLEAAIEEIGEKASKLATAPGKPAKTPYSPCSTLVFCVGENGLDLTRRLGIDRDITIKTANWLGPLLVAAGMQQVSAILLFGYHGKLIKLAGGIFHTHHHLADGRLEILTAHCAGLGLPTPWVQKVFACATAEDALKLLRQLDAAEGSDWVTQVYSAIASTIDQRTQAYIQTHSERDVLVGSVLFDRDRQIIVKSKIGETLLSQLC